jgi:eukaryotic-like serine/threonine-protein kinase
VLMPPHDVVGRRFGDYEITAKLGEGGMGEVYRARDRKLGRDVAIKILPAAFVGDRDRMLRFEREARLLATVNHRFIGAIYGSVEMDGLPALVLELVDGQTLSSVLARGPLNLPRALAIAAQVADALDHAHRRGITHRDLKPSNIMLTRDGVKLLDFGVGKWTPAPTDATATRPPTLTSEGAIVGTLHYMSPEQLEARPVDARSDIFSLGAVMFEMLSGRKAFDGTSQAAIIAAVMQRPSPRLASDGLAPPNVDRVVAKCLEKDPEQRWQSAGDLRDALAWLAADDSPVTTPAQSQRGAALAAVAAVLVLALAGWAASGWRADSGHAPAAPVVRFTLPQPTGRFAVGLFDISADGTRLVFGVRPERGPLMLHARQLDRFDAFVIPGTERASLVAISPDGQWIAFEADQTLKKAPLSATAAAITLAEDLPGVHHISWPADDSILLAARDQPIRRISANGGPLQALTTLRTASEVDHHGPELLPSANALLFAVHSTRNRFSIVAQRLDGSSRKTIIESGFGPRVLRSGHLVFGRGSSLLAVPFDARTLEVRGEPVTVLEHVAAEPVSGISDARVSPNGTLIYQAEASRMGRELVWVDPAGRETPLPVAGRNFAHLAVSPDGRQVAFSADEDGRRDIFIYELASGRLARLTQDGANWGPIWTSDGAAIVFGHDAGDRSEIILSRLAGNTRETLGASVNDLWPMASDGGAARVLVMEQPPTDDMFLSLLANRTLSRLRPGVTATHGFARLSPDGRWLAYQESIARRAEIFIQGFPDDSARHQITVDGGQRPLWRRDSKELYFKQGNSVFAVSIDTRAGLAWGKPRLLFTTPYPFAGFDVAPDGRFLFVKPGPGESTIAPISVVAGWHTELASRVPIPK